jgi:hypothetical protein
MGLTVQEALEIASLKKAKVVGGHQGLNNIIRFVNVMEVPGITLKNILKKATMAVKILPRMQQQLKVTPLVTHVRIPPDPP